MDAEETPFAQTHSVTLLIERLKQIDHKAAEEIWQRYFQRLLPLARAKLQGLPDRVVDEEDVLVSIFDRFFRAAQEGRFCRLNDRDDLWQLLLLLTEHKVADQYRRSQARKRGGREVSYEGDLSGLGLDEVRRLAQREPDPAFVAAFNDSLARTVARLNDETVRDVALLRLEGYGNREIAKRLGISVSSVERKLRVVRRAFEREFSH